MKSRCLMIAHLDRASALKAEGSGFKSRSSPKGRGQATPPARLIPRRLNLNANKLKEAGEALFGEQWKAPLARELNIHVTTLWRYLQRDKVPKPVALAIEAMLSKKVNPHT